jgi:hypothetical protein
MPTRSRTRHVHRHGEHVVEVHLDRVGIGLLADAEGGGRGLVGRPFDEETLFSAAQVIEDAAGRTVLPARWW